MAMKSILSRVGWLLLTIYLFKNWREIYGRKLSQTERDVWRLALRNGPTFFVKNKATTLPIVAEIWYEEEYGDLRDLKSARGGML
jgi:hypothetical protein